MKIDTTIIVKKALIKKIKATGKKLNLSFSEIISLLIKEIIKKGDIHLYIAKTVKYQKKILRKHRKRKHLYLSVEDYEVLTDLRKFTKRSVSLIIAEAAEKYLDKVINKIEDTVPDNYPYNLPINGYFLSGKSKNGFLQFRIQWKDPEL